MKPILSLSDKRVQKLARTHAAFMYRQASNEWKFYNLDNLPEKWLGWKFIRVVPAARSGFTISESIARLNSQLAGLKVTVKRKTTQKGKV